MKRTTSIGVAIASASLVLTACGSESTTDAASTPATSQESVASEPESEVNVDEAADEVEEVEEETTGEGADADISVNEGFLSTDITIPKDLVLGRSAEELEKSFKDDGFDVAIVVNKNGSATYTMSRGDFNRLNDEFRTGSEEAIQAFIDDEPSVYKSVTFTDDFRTFDVTVDRKAYEKSMSMFTLSVGFSSYFVQIYSGIKAKDAYVIVNYIDESTGEVFDTYDSRDN